MKRIFFKTYLWALLIALVAIHVAYFFNDQKINFHENRMYHPIPQFSFDKLKEFTHGFDLHFGDKFGFRQDFIALHHQIQHSVFCDDVSPFVLYGKENWMFFIPPQILADIGRRNLLSDNQLKAYEARLQQKDKLFKGTETKAYKSFFPEAYILYPEVLPDRLRHLKPDSCFRMEQIESKLLSDVKLSHIQYISVRDCLEARKNQELLYFKHDPHWNENGAFHAYQKLIREIAKDYPQITPYSRRDFDILWVKDTNYFHTPAYLDWSKDCFAGYTTGDHTYYYLNQTSRLAGVKNNVQDSIPIFKFNGTSEAEVIASKKMDVLYLQALIYNPLAQTAMKLVIFGDSYTDPMLKFFSLHFRYIVYQRGGIQARMIQNQKPDVVLDIHAGRGFELF